MRLSLAFVLAATWFQVNAALIPDKDREELIVLVLKNFWGRAKLSNGQYAQPSSEAERNSVPV
jgi:hypothetical protein